MKRQTVKDSIDQRGLLKLKRGQIHRHRPIFVTLKMPLAELAAGFVYHPVTHRDNQPGFLCQLQEYIRRQQSLFRMLPAQQSLKAQYWASRCMEFRLIVQAQFIAIDGQPQIVHQL
ncbi:hypothetical protein D3C76_1382980 [compost metagenome]